MSRPRQSRAGRASRTPNAGRRRSPPSPHTSSSLPSTTTRPRPRSRTRSTTSTPSGTTRPPRSSATESTAPPARSSTYDSSWPRSRSPTSARRSPFASARTSPATTSRRRATANSKRSKRCSTTSCPGAKRSPHSAIKMNQPPNEPPDSALPATRSPTKTSNASRRSSTSTSRCSATSPSRSPPNSRPANADATPARHLGLAYVPVSLLPAGLPRADRRPRGPQHDLTAAISGRTSKPPWQAWTRWGTDSNDHPRPDHPARSAHTKGDVADDRPYREHSGRATLR